MVKASLVVRDLEVEGLVVAALSRARIPVTAVAVDRDRIEDLDEWQLIVVTSLLDTKGPREAYSRILEALSSAGVYQAVPFRKIFAKSPGDPAAKRLVQELKSMTEGSIHIIQDKRPNTNQQYSMVFAPYSGSGGPIPSVPLVGEVRLRQFLAGRLGIDAYAIEEAFAQLSRKGSASIFNVQLNPRRARRLKLVA